MSEAPGSSSEYNEADYLEQVIDVEDTEPDDEVEAPSHLRGRAAASSLEANPADLEEQEQEVVLEEPEETSTLEQE